MLSLKKLLSNHLIFLRKIVISSMTIFLLLFGVIPVKVNKVYADENVNINPFIWLMSYFGINIYTDAVQINEAFDTAIRLAYNTYLASLQPQQQVSIDEIIGNIEWIPSEPNVLRVTGKVFNALKGFANWINSRSIDNSSVIIGDFEVVETGAYITNWTCDFTYADSGSNYDPKYQGYYIGIDNPNVRVLGISSGTSRQIYFIYDQIFKYNQRFVSGGSYPLSSPCPLTANTNARTTTYDNTQYYYYSLGNTYNANYDKYNEDIIFYDKFSDLTMLETAIYYTYGLGSSSGDITLNDIFALPDQAVLDDLIGAADPNQDIEIDLTGSDVSYTTAATLEDILSAINNLVDTYVQDNSYAETIGKIIAQGIAIDDELVDVTYPEALTWEVPDLISIPAVYPIIYPDCPDLSACLISGVQEVSNTMNGIINAHPDTGNYVTAALYMGLVLLILGSTVL